jgi:hypothetical protein
MNSQILERTTLNHHTATCPDSMISAEQELTTFFSAVKKLFGFEQAKISAEDWLNELEAINRMPASTRDWRRITINAATKLAARVGQSKPTVGLSKGLVAA